MFLCMMALAHIRKVVVHMRVSFPDVGSLSVGNLQAKCPCCSQ